MTSSSMESRELDLVGKVEMRIALAKDDQLQTLLKTYLPPLLLKLTSEHVNVRNKVVSTCQHIKTRLGGNPNVVLPVAALLMQFKDNPNSSMLRHFDLMFIQQSVGKLTTSEQLDLIPILMLDIHHDANNPTCATIFNLLLRLLPSLTIPERGSKDDKALRKTLGLDEHPEDAKFTADWIGKLILLTIIRPARPGATCAGLSVQDYDFLTLSGKPEAWDPNAKEGLNLTQTKITALQFLASGAFTDEERYFPALFASADSNSRISSIGDDILKRSMLSAESQPTIEHLFQIYAKCKPALQTKLLGILSKSVISTTFTSQIISIVDQGIRPHDNTNLPAPGLEATKFYTSLFNYMNWISRNAIRQDRGVVAPKVVSLLRGYIEDQGWPAQQNPSTDAATLRGLAYETLGMMANADTTIVATADLDILRWLFRSLTEDPSSADVLVSIEGALASLLHSFAQDISEQGRVPLRHMLLEYMLLKVDGAVVRSARFAAVRWANRCLTYNDIVARWIDILALSGHAEERSDVIEEGKKGLDPYWYRILNAVEAGQALKLCDWPPMVTTFYTSTSLLDASHVSNAMKTGMDIDSVSVFGNFSSNRMNAYATSVSYCRHILLLEINQKSKSAIDIDAAWQHQVEVLARSDKHFREACRVYLETVDRDAFGLFLTAAFEGMIADDGKGLGNCAKDFVQIASLAPPTALETMARRFIELLPCIRSNDADTRITAAHALGILAAHTSAEDANVLTLLQTFLSDIATWKAAVGAEENRVHGALVALGYLLSQWTYHGQRQNIQEAQTDAAIEAVLDVIKGASSANLKEAAFRALTQLCAAGFPLQKHIGEKPMESDAIKSVVTEAKKGNERAIRNLGTLAMAFDLEETASAILDALYELHEFKQVDTQFTIGEALGCATAGWDSDVLPLSSSVSASFKKRIVRHDLFEALLVRLLADCKTTKPSLKKASGIWLFSIVQNCGHLPAVQTRLRECQAAFMGLLSARDELVQETASRGLSLVYEQGDEDLKARLVSDLVASFTGTSTQLKVHEDTELFEPGALPTGEGNSVTSYKDIISLANEVGDQTLVYKFMSLAANAATWSTRSAFGRFGLSNILSQGEVDPKLYPKLYRYRFDPNPNVRRSMNDIWNALVKNPSETIKQYFPEILEDLLKSILTKEWRTREASCAAIAELVQGQDFEMYEKHLSAIWEVAFKVMDDIKGSVRKAALKLSMALTGILVRQVEAGTSSKHAQAMLKEVLPFLLSNQGLESSAEDVRHFATATVLKLVKKAGVVILPFVPTLIEQLLNLLSTSEMAGVDYLYLNAAKYDLTEAKIDTARTKLVSHSPLMEAIERCIDLMDQPTMDLVIPRLQNTIKTAVGMPSKVGAAGVLVSMATRRAFALRPHADLLLRDTEKAVLDRNAAVSAAYARAAGYLSRLASEKAITRLTEYSKTQYLTAEDETRRQIAADIIYAISKFATDRFNELASLFLPFVFLAKHDFDEHVKDRFEATWSENVGGSRTVLLYMQEIAEICSQQLESPKWTIKHTAAMAVAEAATAGSSEISGANAAIIWPVLEKALALKTFDGKEKLLASFVSFTKASRKWWSSDDAVKALMQKIMVREAKRNNDAYRPHAWTSLGEFAELRRDVHMFPITCEIVKERLKDVAASDKMEVDEGDGKGVCDRDTATISAGVAAVIRAVNTYKEASVVTEDLKQLLSIMQPLMTSPTTAQTTRGVYYERVTHLFKDLHADKSSSMELDSQTEEDLITTLELASGTGTESIRLKRAEAAEAVAKMLRHDAAKKRMQAGVAEARAQERALAVQQVLDRVLQVV